MVFIALAYFPEGSCLRPHHIPSDAHEFESRPAHLESSMNSNTLHVSVS